MKSKKIFHMMPEPVYSLPKMYPYRTNLTKHCHSRLHQYHNHENTRKEFPLHLVNASSTQRNTPANRHNLS